jgi:CheY-like chemotaxis protein
MDKGRIFLFHWNAEEAAYHAEQLREWGWRVEVEAEDGARGSKALIADPPNVILIYHTRLPSHGRATADYLAQHKATQDIPIVFVGGDYDALQKTRAKLPGAIYVSENMLKPQLDEMALS